MQVQQSNRGDVIEVALARCEGDTRWQLSLVHAIERASPLPAPPDPAVFTSSLQLAFQATAYVPGGSDEGFEPANARVASTTSSFGRGGPLVPTEHQSADAAASAVPDVPSASDGFATPESGADAAGDPTSVTPPPTDSSVLQTNESPLSRHRHRVQSPQPDRDEVWRRHGQELQPVVQQRPQADPDISLPIVDALHALQAVRVRDANQERIQGISWMQDPAHRQTVAKLKRANEDLGYIIDGVDLPGFLRTPPPVFSVKTAGPAIRVVAMGDFGTDGKDESEVAAAMREYARTRPYDFGITLGDNFYFPMKSPDDPKWGSVWEKLYGPMNIAFYPAFGNHDWGGEVPAVELLYSARSSSWHFPAPYYTYVAGPAQFFVVNVQFGNDGCPASPRPS